MAFDVTKAFIFACILAASIHVSTSCGFPKNATCATDVNALKNLQTALRHRRQELRGWDSDLPLDPCGRRNCGDGTEQPCNYEGLTCKDWRVVKIMLDCPRQARGCRVDTRIDLPVELDELTALTHLSMANNWLSGTLHQWNDWPSLLFLNLSGNLFTGPLPENWMGLTNLQVIDVSQNGLQGKLPAPWSSLSNLHTLDLADNALAGNVPLSWTELELDKLDLRNNCGLCGAIVNFGNATVLIEGSNLGGTCHAFNCNSQFFAHIMIIVSLVFGVLALCLLQRHLCMRCRNRQLRDRMASGLVGQDGAAANQVGQVPNPATPSSSLKLSQLAVVVMPDGQTVAFGRKLSSDNLEHSTASANDLKQPNSDTNPGTDGTPLAHPAFTRFPSTNTITITNDPSGQPAVDVTVTAQAIEVPEPQAAVTRVEQARNRAAWDWVRPRLWAIRPLHGSSLGRPVAPPVRQNLAPSGIQVYTQRWDARGNPVPQPGGVTRDLGDPF